MTKGMEYTQDVKDAFAEMSDEYREVIRMILQKKFRQFPVLCRLYEAAVSCADNPVDRWLASQMAMEINRHDTVFVRIGRQFGLTECLRPRSGHGDLWDFRIESWADFVAIQLVLVPAQIIQLQDVVTSRFMPVCEATKQEILPVLTKHVCFGQRQAAKWSKTAKGKKQLQAALQKWLPFAWTFFAQAASRNHQEELCRGMRTDEALAAVYAKKAGELWSPLGLQLPTLPVLSRPLPQPLESVDGIASDTALFTQPSSLDKNGLGNEPDADYGPNGEAVVETMSRLARMNWFFAAGNEQDRLNCERAISHALHHLSLGEYPVCWIRKAELPRVLERVEKGGGFFWSKVEEVRTYMKSAAKSVERESNLSLAVRKAGELVGEQAMRAAAIHFPQYDEPIHRLAGGAVVYLAQTACAWQTLADLPGGWKVNPFDTFLEVLDRGHWPLGILEGKFYLL